MESEVVAASPVPPPGGRRFAVIDGLRGLASLAVCWYHLVWANGAFAGGGVLAAILRGSARNAWVGVEVFFVISGFVIPLSLYRSDYNPRRYGLFVAKRVLRLDPPYLVSIVLSVALWYLWAHVPRLHGPPFTLTVTSVLLHLAYLNAFVHGVWLNPVYWTLAIEFQYYLGIGLLFAALSNRRSDIRFALFAGLGALAVFIPAPNLVFHYLFLFMLGVATFQYVVGLMNVQAYALWGLVLAGGCWVTLGPLVAGVAVATAILIATVRRGLGPLTFLGTISYSLYLVHVPVGGRLLQIGLTHVHGGPARLAVLVITLLLTVGVAYFLYWAVERPAQRWSSSLRYRRSDRSARQSARAPVTTGIAEP